MNIPLLSFSDFHDTPEKNDKILFSRADTTLSSP